MCKLRRSEGLRITKSERQCKMFDCEITVAGDGRGMDGRFKKDKTGPISRFMVDNCYLYTIVKQHVVTCSRCDPTEALRHYLQRRLTLKQFQSHGGAITGSLARQALSYERLCRKTRPVPMSLVNEYIWRTADMHFICDHEKRLSIRELVAAHELITKSNGAHFSTFPQNTTFGKVAMVLQHHAVPTTEQELEDLIQIAEVTLC